MVDWVPCTSQGEDTCRCPVTAPAAVVAAMCVSQPFADHELVLGGAAMSCPLQVLRPQSQRRGHSKCHSLKGLRFLVVSYAVAGNPNPWLLALTECWVCRPLVRHRVRGLPPVTWWQVDDSGSFTGKRGHQLILSGVDLSFGSLDKNLLSL